MRREVPQIFDDRRRALRLARAKARQARPDAARWLGDAMADDALERLDFLRFAGRSALLSGLGSEALARGLAARGWTTEVAEHIALERPLAERRVDLIAIMGGLDTVNDLPGALIHLHAALAPGGLLLASLVGAGSLPQLRAAMLAADGERPAARVHPMIDAQAASGLLQRAGFARQVTDTHPLTVRYGALLRLVNDLRDQAAGSVLRDRAPALTRAARRLAEEAFLTQADPDGRVSERFEILTLTAWRD
ncbi:methyltransferase domain-containing protein [Qipengyuania sediminis]|uniref:methyltransferase domain-containing protein n=1 Tax=Qipengyuania sediminis TaxID=1532023 RepID=UPI00105A21CE|nr:methyltransferase domain-containing protein [Qipengyuania sediminis]